uniref:Uncharacterized protein n=1 Tax=Cacopsylla melanoneura TaxID=428564 RepID=A0A8D9E7K0_9HEMI
MSSKRWISLLSLLLSPFSQFLFLPLQLFQLQLSLFLTHSLCFLLHTRVLMLYALPFSPHLSSLPHTHSLLFLSLPLLYPSPPHSTYYTYTRTYIISFFSPAALLSTQHYIPYIVCHGGWADERSSVVVLRSFSLHHTTNDI